MRRHLTKETCFTECKKYKYVADLKSTDPAVYHVILKNKWIDEFTWLIKKPKGTGKGRKPKGYWNFENCLIEAGKCLTKSEFQVNNPSAYLSAKRNNWLDKLFNTELI